MSLTGKLWEWLTASEGRRRSKGHPDLYPLDVEQLTKELNVKEEARRLGQAGLPSPSTQTLSGPEAAIVQRVEKARQDYVDWAARRLAILGQDASKHSVDEAVNRALQADKEFERKASSLIAEREVELRALHQDVSDARGELDEFKARNRLSRPARSPSNVQRWTFVLVAFALAVVEGVINAWLFATGLTTGLIGGFVQAAIAAAFNVTVAFRLGMLAPGNLLHVQPLRKLVGLLLWLVAAAAMVVIAFSIAHYRDALSADMTDPMRAALEALHERPLSLRGLESWMLLGVSIFFALIAFYEGYKMQDPYPGYGEVSDRFDDIFQEYEDEVEDLRQELEALKDEALKSLERDLGESQASVLSLETYIKDKQTTALRLQGALADADNSLDALLKKFRTENELHRAGQGRPTYFDQKPDLKPLPLPSMDVSEDSSTLAAQKILLDKLQAQIQSLRANVQAAFNAQFDRLKPLEHHISATGVA